MISAVLHDSYCVYVQHTNNLNSLHTTFYPAKLYKVCLFQHCTTSENVLVKMRVIPEVLLLRRNSPSGAKVWDVAHVSERAPVRIMFVRELCMCVCVCAEVHSIATKDSATHTFNVCLRSRSFLIGEKVKRTLCMKQLSHFKPGLTSSKMANGLKPENIFTGHSLSHVRGYKS